MVKLRKLSRNSNNAGSRLALQCDAAIFPLRAVFAADRRRGSKSGEEEEQEEKRRGWNTGKEKEKEEKASR